MAKERRVAFRTRPPEQGTERDAPTPQRGIREQLQDKGNFLFRDDLKKRRTATGAVAHLWERSLERSKEKEDKFTGAVEKQTKVAEEGFSKLEKAMVLLGKDVRDAVKGVVVEKAEKKQASVEEVRKAPASVKPQAPINQQKAQAPKAEKKATTIVRTVEAKEKPRFQGIHDALKKAGEGREEVGLTTRSGAKRKGVASWLEGIKEDQWKPEKGRHRLGRIGVDALVEAMGLGSLQELLPSRSLTRLGRYAVGTVPFDTKKKVLRSTQRATDWVREKVTGEKAPYRFREKPRQRVSAEVTPERKPTVSETPRRKSVARQAVEEKVKRQIAPRIAKEVTKVSPKAGKLLERIVPQFTRTPAVAAKGEGLLSGLAKGAMGGAIARGASAALPWLGRAGMAALRFAGPAAAVAGAGYGGWQIGRAIGGMKVGEQTVDDHLSDFTTKAMNWGSGRGWDFDPYKRDEKEIAKRREEMSGDNRYKSVTESMKRKYGDNASKKFQEWVGNHPEEEGAVREFLKKNPEAGIELPAENTKGKVEPVVEQPRSDTEKNIEKFNKKEKQEPPQVTVNVPPPKESNIVASPTAESSIDDLGIQFMVGGFA